MSYSSKISDTFSAIEQWAEDRNLIQGATPHAQLVKLMEETGELAHAIGRGNEDLVKDSIGDIIVVLTILSKQFGMNVEDCVEAAYNEIKDRKGQMVNGIFVKESNESLNALALKE